MDCLDDNVVNAYVARKLEAAELARVVDHLATCDACLTLTCAVAGAGDGAVETTRVGRYALVEKIGEGAMGSVYLASDPQLGREVALKVVRSARFAEAAVRARMSREARAMAQVRAPNVVAVYDAGEVDDGVFIAMELVDGETLARWRERPRSWREVVGAFIGAARGLAAAHRAGIVHRDFKPQNVLVDRDGHVSVTDFGVAAFAGEHAPGTVIGTPRYMAPEQQRGEAIDARADQFSFGVALSEALQGSPRRLQRIVDQLRAPDPASRFADMAAVEHALVRAVAPRWHVPMLAAAVLACVLAVIALWPRGQVPGPPRRTVVFVGAFANTSGAAELDDTVDVAFASALADSTRLDTVAGPEIQGLADALQLAAGDASAIAKAAAPERATLAVRGSLAKTGDGYRVAIDAGSMHLGATAPTPDALLARASELGGQLLATLDPGARAAPIPTTRASALHAWAAGMRAAMIGDSQAAAVAFGHAAELDAEFADAHASRGLSLYNLGDKPAAIAALERAVVLAPRLAERRRLTMLGDYYSTVGRYSEAILAYQQLLAKWPFDERAQVNLSATALESNSWPLALETARAAAAAHPTFEIVRRNLLLAEVGNNLFDDAIRDGARLVAEDPNVSETALATLAVAYVLAGNRAAANAVIAKLPAEAAGRAAADLALYEGRLDDAFAAVTGTTPSDHLVRARVRLRRGDRTGALAAARLALAEDTLPLAYLAASVAVAAGDASEAERRIEPWRDLPETDRRMYAELLASDVARAAGRWEDAIRAARRAGAIGASWLVHDRAARALRGAGRIREANAEAAWCRDHRGEAALVANPSLSLLTD